MHRWNSTLGPLDELGGAKPRLGVLDCGVKYNILRHLCMLFDVVWCPPDMDYDRLRKDYAIDALFCSNGPGDPAHPGRRRLLETPSPVRFRTACP